MQSATELADAIAGGERDAVDVVEECLQAIERLDPELNAFVTVRERAALLEEAARPRPGPFSGVPIPIKDLSETEGLRTTMGSRAFRDYVGRIDVNVVRRLKAAGFVVLGKTNTPEFGTLPVTESELNGDCRNPWDASRTPGGSSGGAAVAVATGMAPVAHGSDGGGSIRIPASCCGLFGLKPSRGRISNAPYGETLAGLATSGPITHTVLDAAALLDAVAGYELGDPHWAPPPARPFREEVGVEPGRLRVGLVRAGTIETEVEAVCVEAAERAAALLEELGHEVEEREPVRLDGINDLVLRLWAPGVALYPVADPELLEPHNRELVRRARELRADEYASALATLQRFARTFVAQWTEVDLLLTPTLAKAPIPLGWIQEGETFDGIIDRCVAFIPFTPIANLTGQPAVSLPLHWSEDGLPIGVQLIGAPAGEDVLLRVSSQLEAAAPWRDRTPLPSGDSHR